MSSCEEVGSAQRIELPFKSNSNSILPRMDQSGSQSIESVLPVFRRCRKCTNVFDCLDRLRPMSRFLHQSIEGFIKTCLFEIDLHPRFESVIFLQRREATFWDSMNGIFVQSFVHSSRMSCCCKPKYVIENDA